MTRPTRAVVDIAAIRHNLGVARQYAPESRVMAVIKANGYGHGVLPAAYAAEGADAYAVTSLEEAVPLRDAGFRHRILLLEGIFEPDELQYAVEHSLDLVVHAEWQVEVLEQARLDRRLNCWLKIDTGMHRLGVPPEQARSIHHRLRECASVDPHVRLLTHLACADDRRSDDTERQLVVFERACAELPGERSIANSAGLLGWASTRSDWVRPGVMLFGASPFADGVAERPDLRPAMTLESRIIAIQHYRRGDRVGYAGAYACPEDMRVGVVAIGYGDGYPRHASTGTPVLVNGTRTSIVGRVSMDMLCVDLRGVDTVYVGAPVTLWGRGLPIEEIAAACGTISYELMCQVTPRVHFDYQDRHGEG